MLVKKRDGRVESFKSDKILASIKKAALAVEVKDDDIQRRAAELKSLKNQLIEHGFDEIEAEEQAEEQFEGYLDDGVYTEYDEEEAEEVVDMVLEGIDSLGLDEDDLIDTGLIQDFVEKALLTTGHVKTAKEYIIKRANRERIREMNTSLMKSYEDLTFGKSSEVETKRENANIDGDSSMGTMLKYGSEGAKKFNLLYVVPPEESEAHSNGDIHIHDLDFYSLTETCTCRHSKIIIKDGGPRAKAIETDMGFFDQFLDNYPVDTVVSMLRPIYIYDNGKFTRIKNCVRHSAEGKRVLRIHSKAATFEGTDNHTIPVVTADGGYKELHASEIQVGMRFIDAMYNDDEIKYGHFSPDDFVIISIEELHYDGQYVYDVETTSHYFMTNGIHVHNCCQIDLEKLFHNGFNTGHGFLREPGEIRSYGALACIAIQSNQNDMHKRVA